MIYTYIPHGHWPLRDNITQKRMIFFIILHLAIILCIIWDDGVKLELLYVIDMHWLWQVTLVLRLDWHINCDYRNDHNEAGRNDVDS